MTASTSGGYKERYLRALEDQERLQKQFEFQLDFMRRTVTNLSAAAHGLDKTLDAELLVLREKMRGAKGPQVIEQMERVQAAVAQFEQNRETENAAAAKSMVGLIEQYLELKIPGEAKKKLQQFSKGVKQSLTSYRLYPAVLSELSSLQQMALNAAANPETTFWQRLKPGRTLSNKKDEDGVLVLEGTVIERHEQLEPVSEGETLQIDAHEGEDAEVVYAAPSRLKKAFTEDEDSYEQVALRIAGTLGELIDKIQPNDIVKHKVDIVRIRIKRGMDWFALAVTLEDIRDILLLRYLDVDREFSDYLKHVNSELESISKVLGVAFEREKNQREAAGALTDAVSSQMANLRKSVASNNNIDSLKQEVSTQIEQIQQALTQYKQTDQAPDSDNTLTDQLRALIDRVHSIESESQTTKALLEEERYKATHDPLTELPNREAYNERAFHELQRYKRYGRPLCLAVCDVDLFKRINDSYGHQAGDKVLKLISRILSTRLRKVDFVARYGGEEFVILMPETSSSQALKVLDKIRAAIGKCAFRFKDEPITITISFGIAVFEAEDTVESVFERADEALYQAKDQGRNKCVIAVQPSEKGADSNSHNGS